MPRLSSLCSSSPVPSVATVRTCVCPRWKSPEPCARGSSRTSHVGCALVDPLRSLPPQPPRDRLLHVVQGLFPGQLLRVRESLGDQRQGGPAHSSFQLGVGGRQLHLAAG